MGEPVPDTRPLRITPEEVAAAVPPPRRWEPPQAQAGSDSATAPVSRLAVASLTLALVGVPLVGCLLGPIAIVCGALALSQLHGREDRRGSGLALAGLGVGVLTFVGWSIGLWLALQGGPLQRVAAPPPEAFGFRALALADAPPHIRRARLANVRLTCAGDGEGQSLGSGVTVAVREGKTFLLSNRHVAECAPGLLLRVAFHDGEEVGGAIAWRGPEGVDLVVVEARSARDRRGDVMAIAPGSTARVGDSIFAVGNPLGYDATFTAGVLSAVRRMPLATHDGRVYQVQAAMNPGNSGGGLYTAAGQLLGVNTWAGEKTVSEGLGFAIGIDTIAALLGSAQSPLRELVASSPPESKESP
ncbi:MAG TPA: trypsin-like peptidase domain-containing protein [Aggregicoccus sp.]|nr:trypsin-like peptidase domain-containing protein [Aggregicoccus sp.]